METQRAKNVFARAWELLRENPIVVVPAVVFGVLFGALSWYLAVPYLTSAHTYVGVFDVFERFESWFVSVIGAVVTVTYTTGMAEALWARGSASLGDGWRALRADLLGASVAFVVWIVLGAGAALLGPLTLFLPLLAFGFLTPYVMAAVVVGGYEPVRAFNESFILAWNYPVNTAVMLVGVAFSWIIALLFASLLSFIPLVGPVLANLIEDVALAYATIVFVGEYINIRGARASSRALP